MLCFINIRTFIQFKQRRLRNKQLSKNISSNTGEFEQGIFFLESQNSYSSFGCRYCRYSICIHVKPKIKFFAFILGRAYHENKNGTCSVRIKQFCLLRGHCLHSSNVSFPVITSYTHFNKFSYSFPYVLLSILKIIMLKVVKYKGWKTSVSFVLFPRCYYLLWHHKCLFKQSRLTIQYSIEKISITVIFGNFLSKLSR